MNLTEVQMTFNKNREEQYVSYYYLLVICLTLFSMLILFSGYMLYINWNEDDSNTNIFQFDLGSDYKLLDN